VPVGRPQISVYLFRFLKSVLDRVFRDLVEHHTINALVSFFGTISSPDAGRSLRLHGQGRLQDRSLRSPLLLSLIQRRSSYYCVLGIGNTSYVGSKLFIDVHAKVLCWKVLDVPDRGEHGIVVAEIFIYSFAFAGDSTITRFLLIGKKNMSEHIYALTF
jgi:hypothetical protein